MTTPRVEARHTAVLVVDMQGGLLPHMHNGEAVIRQVELLLHAATALKLPIIATEQYPKGLKATIPQIARLLDDAVLKQEKTQFSALTQQVHETLRTRGIRTVIVTGIEAHVCVLQTCLDLIQHGFIAVLPLDAVGSRRKSDMDAAVMRMTQAGVIPSSVESVILEIVADAAAPEFKAILPLVR